jgi:hypothetical protein
MVKKLGNFLYRSLGVGVQYRQHREGSMKHGVGVASL